MANEFGWNTITYSFAISFALAILLLVCSLITWLFFWAVFDAIMVLMTVYILWVSAIEYAFLTYVAINWLVVYGMKSAAFIVKYADVAIVCKGEHSSHCATPTDFFFFTVYYGLNILAIGYCVLTIRILNSLMKQQYEAKLVQKRLNKEKKI